MKRTKHLSRGYKLTVTSLVMGSTHHWRTCHALYPQKAVPAFHWPTRVDCNWGPRLQALLARCPSQHSHEECWDCSHEEISDDKTNSSLTVWPHDMYLLRGVWKLIIDWWFMKWYDGQFHKNYRYQIMSVQHSPKWSVLLKMLAMLYIYHALIYLIFGLLLQEWPNNSEGCLHIPGLTYEMNPFKPSRETILKTLYH